MNSFGQWTKAKRFWLFIVGGLLVVTPIYYFVKENAPLLHSIITLLANLFMVYGFWRWVYEHWDD